MRSAKACTYRRLTFHSRFCAFALLLLIVPIVQAATATTTTLNFSSTSVASGALVTLSATVKAGSLFVSPGQVTFYDGKIALGTAALPKGVATYKLRTGAGNHEITATFVGTTNYEKSTSSAEKLTVTDSLIYPTTTSIQSSLISPFTLTGTVVGTGAKAAVTGDVSFLNVTANNAVLGTGMLGSSTEGIRFLRPAKDIEGTIGDFNGDGIPDLVVDAYLTGPGIQVLFGNGDGTFTDGPITLVSGYLDYLVVGDFNGDGLLDIAANPSGMGYPQVFLGNGNGTFKSGRTVGPGVVSKPLVVGDFNGDGIPDLITTGSALIYTGPAALLWLGNGDGTFRAGADLPLSIPYFGTNPVAGDLNGDGITDLIAFGSQIGAPAVSSNEVLLGNADGTFRVAAPLTLDPYLFQPLVADFNGDGILDLASEGTIGAGFTPTISVSLGNGDGTFGKGTTVYSEGIDDFQIGDFNGDGIPDLAVIFSFGSTTLLLGKGDGTFEKLSAPSPGVSGSQFATQVADFNGDGVSDLLVPSVGVMLDQLSQTATATVSGVPGPGTGSFQVKASYPGDQVYGASLSSGVTLANAPAAVPIFTPAAGGYVGPLVVSIVDTTPGVAIYYTTDGTTPTIASSLYTVQLTLFATETLKAVALVPQSAYSPVASATYTITQKSPKYGLGFTASGLALNKGASIEGTALRLAHGRFNEATSAYFTTPINVTAFLTEFDFQFTNAMADGFTFVIQNQGLTALGSSGSGLGYGVGLNGTGASISRSVAVKFDIHDNKGEGPNSVGLYVDGASPTIPATAIYPANLNNGDVFHVSIGYSGPGAGGLYVSFWDKTANTSGFFFNFPVDIPAVVGADTAYVGFTAGTGTATATLDVLDWTCAGVTPSSFAGGFVGDLGLSVGLALNGGAQFDFPVLSLTDTLNRASAGSAYYVQPLNIQKFTTDFDFQLLNAVADGFTFVVQNQGLTALGSIGAGLGYGVGAAGTGASIGHSVAVKFDIHNNSGEGTDSTGLYLNGASPTLPGIDLSKTGIQLNSGDIIHAHIVYDGTNLTLTLTDASKGATAVEIFPVDIPAVVGGNTAYVGFTGSTGAGFADQHILNWRYKTP